MGLKHEDYRVAWICALPLEMAAAKSVLTEVHPSLPVPEDDGNTYTLGGVSGRNIVITCLPSAVDGKGSYATVVAHMLQTFPALRFGLLVGIGGGVPSQNNDIRLGDVVVSIPYSTSGALIQYDYGKTIEGRSFERTRSLNKPPISLLTAVSQLQSDYMTRGTQFKRTISETLQNKEIQQLFPRPDTDWLFKSDYYHEDGGADCSVCDQSQLVPRAPRETNEFIVHYGAIASGNQVVEDAMTRDHIAQNHNILCFEMEAAGVIDQLPCLVIRGICDYCDSHKNKEWERYAAFTAAAYTAELLAIISNNTKKEAKTESDRKTEFTAAEKACLQDLYITDTTNDRNGLRDRNGQRAPSTCTWILETGELKEWLRSDENSTQKGSNIFWLYGDPGTGKSTIATTLTEEIAEQADFASRRKTLAYFFCDFSSAHQRTATAILRGLLYQLITQNKSLIKYLLPKYGEWKEKLFTSLDTLWSVLLDVGQDPLISGIYLIIDALDECEPDEQSKILHKIHETFNASREIYSSSQIIHFLITSRPYPRIHQYLSSFRNRNLSSYPRATTDLKWMIEERVGQLSRRNSYPSTLKISTSQRLETKSEGNFLWATLAIEQLRNVRSRDAIRAIESFPSGIYWLFKYIFDTSIATCDEGDKGALFKVLNRITIARRPLTIQELSKACELYLDEEENERLTFTSEIIRSSGGMIIVWDDKARLVHESARDFLKDVAGMGYEMGDTAMVGLPPGKEINASEQDSGYVSASRPATLALPAETAFRQDEGSLATDEVDEIQSIVSDHDDIASQASDETTYEGMTGKALIGIFLAEEPKFRPLCEKAMAKMSKQRFVENLRRLLKSFHKNLTREAESVSQRSVARLLQSRRGRLRISRQVADRIQPGEDETASDGKGSLEVGPEEKHAVETWLGTIETRIDAHNLEREDPDHSYPGSDSDDDSEREEFPYITELQVFLQTARSFEILLKDFMLIFLPADLRLLLLAIPKDHIWVSQEQDVTFMNNMKAWVEDRTRVRWMWWPLEPRKRLLRDGESRLLWQCNCGTQQWEEISAQQHELVGKILELSDDTPQFPHWCRRKRINIFQKALLIVSATITSLAAQRYTPPRNTTPTSSSPQVNSPGNSNQSVQSHHNQKPPITGQQTQVTAGNPVAQAQSWVLFGVKGARRTLKPAQISISDQSTDYSFFQDLRKCYDLNRGRVRLWFSIWRLQFCEVTKFNRLTLEHMVREHRDLPTQQDYLYNPRVGNSDVKNPPFSSHLFETVFYACCLDCTWPIPHNCIRPQTGIKLIERIPKRTRDFQTDQTSPIWGLEAKFAVSFAYVFFYHCLMVAGPFVFFALWLKLHPSDLQNASIPITIFLTALSLFWSSSGILTSRSRD